MLISTNLFKRVVSALLDKPSDGDKGVQIPTCPKGEFNGKPINKIVPFCPRATAEGMAGSGSAVHQPVPNLETGEKALWICGASCARTSAAFICRRSLKPKGRDERTEASPQDEQGCEFRALSKRQGW